MAMRAAWRCFHSVDRISSCTLAKSTGTMILPPVAMASRSNASSPTSYVVTSSDSSSSSSFSHSASSAAESHSSSSIMLRATGTVFAHRSIFFAAPDMCSATLTRNSSAICRVPSSRLVLDEIWIIPLTTVSTWFFRNLGWYSTISTNTSIAVRQSTSSPDSIVCSMVDIIIGTSSWKALRDCAFRRVSKKDASALRAAERIAIALSGWSETRKTCRSVGWNAFMCSFSAISSASALKMSSAASCRFGSLPSAITLPSARRPTLCTRKASRSGHAARFLLRSETPYWPTASHTFFRMCRTCSLCMHASSSCLK
mmetsp:Transcript_82418/g.164305  ORF Transcript_82418/g.164305 Transcript_82418/m.164305 type:complete len:313 (+) Transcript_82418:785-1723(+)